jgi:hypothetical protein
MLRLGIVLLALWAMHVGAKEPGSAGAVKVTALPPVVVNDMCLVRQIEVEIAKGTPDGLLVQEFRWKQGDGLGSSHAGGSGYRTSKTEAHRKTITFVAVLTHGEGGADSPQRLSFYMSDGSKTICETHGDAPAAAKMVDVLRLDVKEGSYSIEERIRIGEYGGLPIHITVSPKALAESQRKE